MVNLMVLGMADLIDRPAAVELLLRVLLAEGGYYFALLIAIQVVFSGFCKEFSYTDC